MHPCNILDKLCILWILVWIHKDAYEYQYENNEVDLFLWVKWGFGLQWACKLLMQTCNVLDKLCIFVNFGIMWILVNN